MAFPCRSCQAPVVRSFANLGLSPLANGFVKADDLNKGEMFYPLHAFVCEKCFLVQLEEFEKPENIFSNYFYFSSYSSSWLEHAKNYCELMTERFRLSPGASVIEIASNDGYLLQFFKEKNFDILGVEPASNVAEVATGKGIPTQVSFFGKKCAEELLTQGRRRADLMVANNVLAHVPDLNDFISGFKLLLADTGVATFEFPHLLNLVRQNQFDTIYHEHFSYISLLSARSAFERHDLQIFDVEELPTHGGSLRIFVQHRGDQHPLSNRFRELEQREIELGMNSVDFYSQFETRVRKVKNELLRFLIDEKKKGATVVGYGAAAKGNTLLNYCGIRNDFLDYVVDQNIHKQGTFLPGTRIPIGKPEKIFETKPNFVLILPWNLHGEISSNLREISTWGGKFVVAIPELRIF